MSDHTAENGLPTNEAIGAHLERRKASLGLQDCTCPWGWHSLGRLYGVNMGKDWTRSSTDADCPNHGHDAQAQRRAAANLPRIGRRSRILPPAEKGRAE